MSLQHLVSSIDDLIAYSEGDSFFYRIDFRIKILWLIVTILTAIIQLDMLFTFYLLAFTLIIVRLGGSPVFKKAQRNKALISFVFGVIILTFVFSSLNRALISTNMKPIDVFFYFARSVALGFLAITIGTLFMSTGNTPSMRGRRAALCADALTVRLLFRGV